ncbi:uncharacterized protein LOC124270314 [Haliotis rubra]|uniref:uncharacterized protein LOC124270314 n=1 Tax=Haliotis rubra TaxID=36100 RepID=UPI001EE55FF5|nr:uncharacterized protein LOC124270314 [Haliotis rubra]
MYPSKPQKMDSEPPTHTDQYIHYNSCHHPKIKLAIIATLTRRAKAICHPDALSNELDHLKHTFTSLNGYPAHVVCRIINKTLKTSKPKPKAAPSPIRITIPYLGPVSHQISRLVKNKANIDVTFSSNKTIKTLLHANGRGTSSSTPNPRGCVYQILCNCGDPYIGETLRPLNTRLKEHQASVNKLDLKSAVSEHINKNQDHAII